MKNPVQILAEMTRGLALSGLMVILVVLLAGCAQPVRLAGEAQLPVDFSGHWEVDYRASDDLQDKIQHLYRLAKDAAMRQQAAARMGQKAASIAPLYRRRSATPRPSPVDTTSPRRGTLGSWTRMRIESGKVSA